jgi:hypothetical protein
MELLHDHLWLHIRRESRISTRMSAAIAYVTDTSAFTLKDGDCLVVNSSDDALISGSTDPRVLRECLKASVNLYSLPKLHAKVITFDAAAFIGSMNASRSSQNRLIECAFLTKDMAHVSQALAFVNQLASQAIKIDMEFLDRAMDFYVRPKIDLEQPEYSTTQRKLWYLEKCPYTNRKNLRAYFLAIVVSQIGDLKPGKEFALWPNVQNMSQHEKPDRLRKIGTRFALTESGVDYFSKDDQWPEPSRFAQFCRAITTGDQEALPDDLPEKSMKPFYV